MSLVNLGHMCAHIQNVTRVNRSLASVPMTKLHLQVALGLYKEGFLSSVQRGDLKGPDRVFTPNTCDNISTRRIWLGLKYHDFKSVIRSMRLVSHPNRRVVAKPKAIADLVAGKPYRQIEPLAMGEVMFVRLANGDVVEIQEAARKKLGGEILCRVN
ncbi:small ribosomal subunit protein uS8m [Trichomonascus vanleenenianus]|uniref:mitochondrial 37S ribosomal protein uS8m MRPS8 n=1 Tax=Trichomonascus vanleenenianus TaxID=2268995 RepID=UPI003ECA12A7